MVSDRDRQLWTLVGLAAGFVAGIWLWRRGAAGASGVAERTGEGEIAARISRALADAPELVDRALDVGTINEGVVEITGVVANREQRERAVAIAHNTPGVHTVVNRLVLEMEESRLEENRKQREEGGSGLHHHGMGVGMGTRRQSPDTDPDRPDDRQKLVDRELDVDRMEAEPAEESKPESTAPDPDADEDGPQQ